MKTIGIFGAGFSGKVIGRLLAQSGYRVWGTSRSTDNFDTLSAEGIAPVLFDGDQLNDDLTAMLAQTDGLIISVAPPRQEDLTEPDGLVDPVLKALKDHSLKELVPGLSWVCYLSTVGVYGNHDGAWVDEDAPVSPGSARSRQRVRAEAEWMAACDAHTLALAVFRLSGIYGPGRNALINAERGNARRLVKPGQVFNRIHVHDIAQAVMLAANSRASGAFNITDDEPAPPQDVVEFAHQLMNKTPPAEIDFETADLSPMARSFYGENKRVSNEKSKRMLGLSYGFPDYRSALEKMWRTDTWRG